MVITACVHSLLMWGWGFQLPRVNSLILHSTISFLWWDNTSHYLFFCWFGMPPCTGSLQTYCCLTCKKILCRRGWITGSRGFPLPGGFPHLMFPSWGVNSSSRISGSKIIWFPRSLCRSDPRLHRGIDLFGKRPSGQLRSWTRVWYPRVTWSNRVSVWF